MPTTTNPALDFVINAKIAYRKIARARTWEEKLADIKKMQIADKAAKEGMRKTMAARREARPTPDGEAVRPMNTY